MTDGPIAPGALDSAQEAAIVELFRAFPVVDELGRRFADAGHQLHLVGGPVRDALLGRLQDDLDFTTDARPEQILAVVDGWAEAVWDIGIAFGTIGIAKRGLRLEITTFRADLYDGESRNPVVTFGDTLAGDLLRRDFAVNAMAVSLPDHQFTDLFGGLGQLAGRVLDTPGTPEQSFRDDPLRMMRAARFAAQLSFTPAPRVVAAMSAMAGEIDRITVERVAAEFQKLLLAANPRAGLTLMVATGLAARVIPELPALILERDEHLQHKDVYEHSLTVLEQAIGLEQDGPDFTLRMAALLHDVGKPATRRFEPGSGVSFHHHEVVGKKLVRKRLRELKYPKQLVDDVAGPDLPAPALPWLRRRPLDGLGRAPVRDRCGSAAAAAEQTGPGRLHHSQPPPAAGVAAFLRRSGGTHRRARRRGGTWPTCGPTWTATPSWSCSGWGRGRWSGAPGRT